VPHGVAGRWGDAMASRVVHLAQLSHLTERTRPWWTLVGACSGMFLLMLDSTVVTLALPAIQRDLDASAIGLQWVMNAYLLTITVLTVTAGRLGDMFGRRLIFLIGLGVFAAGSVLSAVSWSQAAVIAGRIAQGAGGAALLPLSIALVAAAFPTARQSQAYGIWAAVSAVALGIGPLVGGLLIDLDWRLIFWINLPIAVLGATIVLAAARESRDEESGHRIDVPGVLTLTIGLAAVVLALVEANAAGWGSVQTLGTFGVGGASLIAFLLLEHRVRWPIVEFSLFRNGPYFGATAAAFAIVFAYWTVMFFQPQYLQNTLGYSATAAGLLILPITAPMIALSPLSGALIARFGARALMTAGMLLAVAGLTFLTQISESTGYELLLPGYLLFGIALGLVYAPMSAAAMAAMPGEKAGIASGVLAMNRILAGAVGLAVTSAVFHALTESHGFAYSLANSFWVLVAVAAIGAVLTWAFVRGAPAAAPPSRPVESSLHHRRFHL
jgi:EmrB/QacA subfamily drug resistance transporter